MSTHTLPLKTATAGSALSTKQKVHVGGLWHHAWARHAPSKTPEIWQQPHWDGQVPQNKAEFGAMIARVLSSATIKVVANSDIARESGSRRYWVVSHQLPYFKVLMIEANIHSGYEYQIVTAFPVQENAWTRHVESAPTIQSGFCGELWISPTSKFVFVSPAVLSDAPSQTQTQSCEKSQQQQQQEPQQQQQQQQQQQRQIKQLDLQLTTINDPPHTFNFRLPCAALDAVLSFAVSVSVVPRVSPQVIAQIQHAC